MCKELEYLLNVSWHPEYMMKEELHNLAIAKFYNKRIFPYRLADDLIEIIHEHIKNIINQ